MPRAPSPANSPKAKMVLATVELLRQSGLAGAGINQVVEASRTPKGSVYHYFPRGKHELVATALREAERIIGDRFRRVFEQSVPLGQKVRALFTATGATLDANAFTKSCPVAAVTLDLTADSAALREVCEGVFDAWLETIAAGLEEVGPAERLAVASLILVTLEGALILSRARGTQRPLMDSGTRLAELLELRYQPSPSPRRSRRATPARRR